MRILNIGCGNDVYGTDFVDLYPQRKEVKKVDLQKEKLPYKDNTFDEVYSKCVLEHCFNPGYIISEMTRVCKKGGRIRIITDNANYWVFAKKNSLHRGSYEKDSRKEDRHYELFTDWHLVNLFKKEGIKNIQVKYLTEKYENQNKIKFVLKKIFNQFLKITPLKTMAFIRIEISGKK